jgi:hypothetical protein
VGARNAACGLRELEREFLELGTIRAWARHDSIIRESPPRGERSRASSGATGVR